MLTNPRYYPEFLANIVTFQGKHGVMREHLSLDLPIRNVAKFGRYRDKNLEIGRKYVRRWVLQYWEYMLDSRQSTTVEMN